MLDLLLRNIHNPSENPKIDYIIAQASIKVKKKYTPCCIFSAWRVAVLQGDPPFFFCRAQQGMSSVAVLTVMPS
jgi:hypothetical protein